MDKPRTPTPERSVEAPVYIGGGVLLGAVTLGLSQLKPAPPSMDGAAIYSDTVRRGELVRQVRGPGTLTPEHIRIIPAVTAGRVEQIFARPGTVVEPGTPLLRLSNPDVELQLLESERQLTRGADGAGQPAREPADAGADLEGQVAQVQSQYNEAVRQAKTAEELAAKGLIAPNDASRAKDQVEELRKRGWTSSGSGSSWRRARSTRSCRRSSSRSTGCAASSRSAASSWSRWT
jgi:HlyD family secretion protein